MAEAPLGLAPHRAVPVDADGAEVGELAGLEALPADDGIESSTRSRKALASRRANSHATAAVRRLPRCSSPRWCGANRPTGTGRAYGRRSQCPRLTGRWRRVRGRRARRSNQRSQARMRWRPAWVR